MQLNGHVHVAADTAKLYEHLALALMAAAVRAADERGAFHLALSGGSTPEKFYMDLVIDPRWRGLPWEKTHLWVVDERRVAEDDPRCNWLMIRQALAEHVPLKSRQKHPMPVLADDPAQVYEAQLRQLVPGDGVAGVPVLDFVLLGMGDDGHTASLFPQSPALAVRDKLVAVNEGPTVKPPARVTMTFPLLQAARQTAILITGAGKTAMLRQVDAQLTTTGPDPLRLPITGIMPQSEELTWYLDAAAAGSR